MRTWTAPSKHFWGRPVDSHRRSAGYYRVLAAALIFLGTYLVMAIGRLPGFRVDRTGAAIIGASLTIGFNVLSFEEIYYLNKLLPLVRPGGLILAHNVGMAGDYDKLVTTNPALETLFLMEGEGLGITLKKR